MTRPGNNAQCVAETNEILEEVELIEDHLHNEQLSFGSDGSVPPALTDASLIPFRMDAGGVANTWSTPLQIYNGWLGIDVSMDLDKIFFVDAQRSDQLTLAEFWAGPTIFAASTRATSMYYRKGASATEVVPAVGKSPRVRGDLKIWGRVKSTYTGPGTAWIDVVFQLHKYPSDSGDFIQS